MKVERWQQINTVLKDAMEREVSARQLFLDQACAGDKSLRLEVEAYLEACDSTDDFLEIPVLELLARDQAERAAQQVKAPALPVATQVAAAAVTAGIRELDFSPGALLAGRYLIEMKLGEGGFSTVFLAHDQKLHGKKVAVKVLSERLTVSEHREWLEKKFRDEIKSLSLINHPNVVGINDLGQLTDGRSYLVMGYIPGESLRKAMSSVVIPLPRIGKLIEQISQALTAIHEQNVIHRDLKPENIMLQTTGGTEYVKLIDFGIASVREELERTGRQATKTAGTIPYMAPEQLRGNPTPASDIFSLGVIAYEMVTCQRPFDANREFALLEQQRAGVSTKPCALRPELPQAAQEAILRALAFEPADRYARACDFGAALSRALSLEVKEAPPPDLELAHVLFTDLVGYSKLMIEDQTRLIGHLNTTISTTDSFQRAQSNNQLLRLPTGDGLALVFFDDPLAPVRCAVETAVALKQHPEIKLRMGIHTGPVRRTTDINQNLNVAGGGINLAQRVMDCGGAGHILLSDKVADVLSQLNEWAGTLQDWGERQVKHGVKLHVFNLVKDETGNPNKPHRRARSVRLMLAAALVALICLGTYQFIPPEPPLSLEKVASQFHRPGQTGAIPAGITLPKIGGELIGVTTWLFTQASSTLDLTRGLIQKDNAAFIADRVKTDALKQGDKVGLGIEVPRSDNSYVYVIDREVYSDGSMGAPLLIFPGPTMPPGGNVTSAGKLLNVPALGDPIPWLTMDHSRQDQVSEKLTIIVSQQPISFNVSPESLSPNTVVYKLDPAQFEQMEKQWRAPVEPFEVRSTTQAWTRAEQISGEGKGLLVTGTPLPQTIYLAKTKPGDPVLINIPLPVLP